MVLVSASIHHTLVNVLLHDVTNGGIVILVLDIDLLEHLNRPINLSLGVLTIFFLFAVGPGPYGVVSHVLDIWVQGFAGVLIIPILVIEHSPPDARDRKLNDGGHSRPLPKEPRQGLGWPFPPLVGHQLLISDVLPPLLHFGQEGRIPPLYPVVYESPCRVILQILYELVKEVVRGRYLPERFLYHHKRPIDIFLPFYIVPVSVGVVILESDYPLPPSVVVPFIPGHDQHEVLN